MDFFDKFKSLETNPIYGKSAEPVEPFVMPKAWTPQFALKYAQNILEYLGEKYPCPDCEGHCTSKPVGDGYDYPEKWCRTCDGIGIKIPESEV